MTNTEILWLVVGLILGAGVGLLALCLVALGKLGEDGWPTEFPEEPPRRWQD